MDISKEPQVKELHQKEPHEKELHQQEPHEQETFLRSANSKRAPQHDEKQSDPGEYSSRVNQNRNVM